MYKRQCSHCGKLAYYDGRMGDGPILTCSCDKGRWINDGRGGYESNPRNAQPVKYSGWDDDDFWSGDRH